MRRLHSKSKTSTETNETNGPTEPFLRVCYFSLEEDTVHKSFYPISVLDGNLCSHIILGFASIDPTSLTVVPGRPIDPEIYIRISFWKRTMFPSLKLMISLGGGGNTVGFHEACLTKESRSKLIGSITQLMVNYNFDGIDLDWEFPAWSVYDVDRDNFALLLRGIRERFDSIKTETGRELILSIAVSASLNIITVSYDINAINSTVDFINLMSYDYHSFSNIFPFVEFNAPLFRRESEEGLLSTFNVNWSSWYWTSVLGIPKRKLVIGIPSFSHNFWLISNSSTGPGSPSSGDAGEFTFSQVCDFLSKPSSAYVFDKQAGVPYAYDNHLLWSSFDDSKSIYLKAVFIRDRGFGGSMLYDLNSDDYRFKCSLNKRFVLQNIIKDVLTGKMT